MLIRFASLTVVAAMLTTPVQAYSPLRAAVRALHAANETVQAAVFFDACEHGDMLEESTTGRAKLSKKDARAYDRISRKLGKAYTNPAIEPTDETLERIRLDFCAAAKND
jgi:hypothetical protein